jgi:hypothetical protein
MKLTRVIGFSRAAVLSCRLLRTIFPITLQLTRDIGRVIPRCFLNGSERPLTPVNLPGTVVVVTGSLRLHSLGTLPESSPATLANAKSRMRADTGACTTESLLPRLPVFLGVQLISLLCPSRFTGLIFPGSIAK